MPERTWRPAQVVCDSSAVDEGAWVGDSSDFTFFHKAALCAIICMQCRKRFSPPTANKGRNLRIPGRFASGNMSSSFGRSSRPRGNCLPPSASIGPRSRRSAARPASPGAPSSAISAPRRNCSPSAWSTSANAWRNGLPRRRSRDPLAALEEAMLSVMQEEMHDTRQPKEMLALMIEEPNLRGRFLCASAAGCPP